MRPTGRTLHATTSSLLAKLAGVLALDAVREAGLREAKGCLVMPTCTGLAMTMVLLSLRLQLPVAQRNARRRVLWMRILALPR